MESTIEISSGYSVKTDVKLAIVNILSGGGYILPCTQRLLNNFIQAFEELTRKLGNSMISDQNYLDDLKKIKILSRMTPYNPENFSKKVVKLGNAVWIRIDKREPTLFLLDGAAISREILPVSKQFISISSPLGKSIYNQKKSTIGNFNVNGKIHKFRIEEILSYEDAKEQFFGREKGKFKIFPIAS